MNPDPLQFYVEHFASILPPEVRQEFCPPDRIALKMSLRKCGLNSLPPVTGDPNGYRCSGQMICETCEQDYYSHPADWRVIGYGNRPFLNVLCNGQRVKL